jgi:glyoxylase-like metal-dependent hydrolase (beta-lactamase superfamily II)
VQVGPVQVAPGIFRIDSAMGSRRLALWLVVGDEGALLLDTGIAGTVTEHVEPALVELGVAPERVTEIIDSHADVDHYGGNAEARALFPAARIRAHRLDRPLIESWELIAAERYGWYRAYGMDYDEATWRWLADAAGDETRLDGTLEDGEEIDLGATKLVVLHLPGHSAGHLGLFEPQTRTAIIADAAMAAGFEDLQGRRISPPPYLDIEQYRESIARLRSLDPARIGTAHFPPIEGDDVETFLDRSLAFTVEVDDALTAAVDSEPRTLPSLLEQVAERLGGFPEMALELSRSIGAHLAGMEDAGRVERVAVDSMPAWRRA